jgi:hypothetical protein
MRLLFPLRLPRLSCLFLPRFPSRRLSLLRFLDGLGLILSSLQMDKTQSAKLSALVKITPQQAQQAAEVAD